jgi:peptidyl-prolyl cis-trans isomerase D
MLKLMRDSFQQLKWILVAIVAIFILFIFVDWGAGGARSGDPDRGYAARVNGETISFREYDRALYYMEKNYEQLYRQPLSPQMMAAMGLNRKVLDSLVDSRLMLQQAKRLHLGATPEEVRKRILQIPTLNPDGRFVGDELYTRYVTGSLGYQSPAEFEDELARDITLQKMESALSNSIVVSPKAAEAEYRRVSESAKIRYVLYPAAREAAMISVSPAEVDQFYRANQAKYAHGEQRAIKYLLVDTALLHSRINPSESDLRKRYDAAKEEYKRAASAHILHILIKVDPNATPEQDAAAKAKAENLVKQLRARADFAKLAKENSGDPSSSSKGGDMGWVEQGTTVDPFDQAAFSVPLNTIPDPIRSKEFGYHIIKVLERRPAGYRPFEEVKTELAAQLADQMAKDQARDEITRIAAQIKERKPKSASEFTAIAAAKVSSNDTQWFGKTDAIPGIGNNPAVSTWVFNAKQNDVGDIIGTQRGPIIPFLYAIRPAGISDLSEIRARVESDARIAKAREHARMALGKALPAPNIDAVAAKVGLPAAETLITRSGRVAGFTGDISPLVNAAMSGKVGEIKGPIPVNEGAVVFQVVEEKKVDAKAADENRASYAEMLRQQEARNLRAVLLQRLRKESSIDLNAKLLEQQARSSQAGS